MPMMYELFFSILAIFYIALKFMHGCTKIPKAKGIAITAPIVNCHRGIEVLWPKYHGSCKQGLILHSLTKILSNEG